MESIPKIFSYELHQDDPKKCTAAKMRRMGLARGISKRSIPEGAIVLDPSSDITLLGNDQEKVLASGIVVIDCSWVHAGQIFNFRFKGNKRRLPALLAGNPTNYSKLGALSSLEGVAACAYITGFKSASKRLLSIYKWGETFLTLNHDPLEDYSRAETQEEIKGLERAYFPNLVD